jgi:TolB-like protein
VDTLSRIASWLGENEATISAVVGITVLAGVLFAGVRSLVRRRGEVAQERTPAGSTEAQAAADSSVTELDPLTVPGFEGRPAIAVLPFDNLSGDPEQEYFADGIAEDLITRLSAWRQFPVIARNSSFTFKGKAVDVKQVSRELGVRYVVEGSVRRSAGRVRIAAQAIDATTGHHVWAETYDRELREIFELQDEISEAVVASMYPELEQFERERTARHEPKDLDAWDAVQKGWWHYWQFSKEENEKARLLFRSSAEADPHLAGAFSGLAHTHYIDIIFQWTDSPDRSIHGLEHAARKSVALDSTDPLGQLALGRWYFVTGQRDKVLPCFELAVLLNPSLAYGYFVFGLYLARAGKPEEGIAKIEKGMRLSPRDPRTWMGFLYMAQAHLAAGRYEQAVEWAQKSLQQGPDYAASHRILAVSYAHCGELGEAKKALAEALRLQPDFSVVRLKQALLSADPAFTECLADGLRKAGLPE